MEDVLQWLASQVDTTKEFNLCVSRMNLLERGLLLWRRQKMSSPVNTLKITFLGEDGADTGALRKEFLTGQITKPPIFFLLMRSLSDIIYFLQK